MTYKILLAAIISLMSSGIFAQNFEVCVGEPFYLFEWFDQGTGSSSTFDIIGGSAEYELPNSHNFNNTVYDSTWIIITTPGTLTYSRITVNNEDGKSTIGTYNQTIVALSCQIEIDTAVIDTVVVNEPKKVDKFWMPNIFSPNGDSINDMIFPMSDGELLIDEMVVFDRWGKEIYNRIGFYTNDESSGWDGGTNAPGVYIWMLKANNKIEAGNLTLIK